MSDFKTRKIRKKTSIGVSKKLKANLFSFLSLSKNIKKKHFSYFLGFLLIIIAASIVFKVSASAYKAIQNFSMQNMVLAMGSDLKQDENGHINIVLLGDGGHLRDGADLIDTIMLASIDSKNKKVSLFSVPRDYYLRYIKHKEYKDIKINELYRNFKKQLGDNSAYELYQTVLGDMFNMHIDYYIRVDFNAFVEIVDSLGGVTVDVKKDIYDPYYPNNTDNGYTLFEVKKGLQDMTGETALKFVRSRKTTSDFDRALRQQQVLMALKEKALSKEVLTNPKVIKDIYNSVNKNINTNLSIREIISLAAFIKDFNRDNMISKVIHDDPGTEGGFLYTPERKYYNGHFVLVPDGNSLDFIRRYADLVFHHIDVYLNLANIEVLNASKTPGLARSTASWLNRFGFNVVKIDNYTENGKKKYLEKSIIKYYKWDMDENTNIKSKYKSTIDVLGKFVKGDIVHSNEPEPNKTVDISIIIGADHENY